MGKRKFIIALLCVAVLGLSACGSTTGITQEEYDAVVAERDELQGKYDRVSRELAEIKVNQVVDEIRADVESNSTQTDSDNESSIELSDENSTKSSYDEGQYKVGSDIPEGEYIFFASNGTGYFSISLDANGNDILANDNFKYNSIMAIQEGEYLTLSRCYAVPIDEGNINVAEADMLKVGTHIESGEYKLINDEENKGYYCIYSDNRQQDIYANENFSGQSYVNVQDGQYLLLSRCHIEQ